MRSPTVQKLVAVGWLLSNLLFGIPVYLWPIRGTLVLVIVMIAVSWNAYRIFVGLMGRPRYKRLRWAQLLCTGSIFPAFFIVVHATGFNLYNVITLQLVWFVCTMILMMKAASRVKEA